MIYQTLTVSFRKEMLQAIHDLLNDTVKIALYSSSADLDEDTTAYTTTGEVTGTGYSAGGKTLSGASVNSSNGVVYVSFSNPSWTGASFTAAGALIYNSSKANRSIAVLSFGNDKTSTTTFTIQLPSNTYSSALLRF